MSLHHAAQHLAAQGRGPDRTLVHMSPREVAGLQALAKAQGGSLTVNPETGLVEAGFLDRMLPTILGAGLMFATGGTSAALTPELIGMGVGGLQTARTGSLGKGLMAGLGAYGGAGMASGFGAGAPEVTPAPAPAQAPVAAPAPFTPDYSLQAPAGTGVTGVTMPPAGSTGAPTLTAPVESPFQLNSGMSNADRIASAGNTGSLADRISAAGAPTQSGIGSLTGKEAFKYGAASLGSMADTGPKPLPGEEHYTGPLSKYRMSDKYTPYDQQQPSPYYTPQYQTYAGGGPVEQMSNDNAIGANTGYPMANMHQGVYSTPYQTPVSQNVVQGVADTGVNSMTGEENRFAGGGGISDLGGYSDGGRMLKGPGDGMSDSIPAQIGGKQPARLADGEFVVPADVVSHLGNGSTDAGAKQLYKMMDRIRQQRTGKKKQAPEVHPGKAMPA